MGDGELPFEAEDFHEDLENIDLSGKKVAVFGSGDTAYELFCEAVTIFEERLVERGAELVQEGLKIELAPEDEEDVENAVILQLHLLRSSKNGSVNVETMLSATAITKLRDGKLMLATTYNGLFIEQDGEWKQILNGFQKRIRIYIAKIM